MIVIKYNQNEECDASAHIKNALRCITAYEKAGIFEKTNEKIHRIVIVQ